MFYAGKIVERRNGAVVRDLTTVETETGSVYVVMPVPASVKAAIGEAQGRQPAASSKAAEQQPAAFDVSLGLALGRPTLASPECRLPKK